MSAMRNNDQPMLYRASTVSPCLIALMEKFTAYRQMMTIAGQIGVVIVGSIPEH